MQKKAKRMLIILLLLIVLLAGGSWLYLQHPKFGGRPDEAGRTAIQESPHYKDGKFQNLIDTPMFVSEKGRVSSTLEFIFSKKERTVPNGDLPSVKRDLKSLAADENIVIWLGHSSFFLQLDGRKILIDPILSDYASPVFFINKAFKGTTIYSADDLPEIDYLLISHDHWDHLDYYTVTALRAKIKKVVTGLGVGAHFERWGFPREMIHEADWNESLFFGDDFSIHILPARHFSGRLFKANQTLWVAFALQAPGGSVFFSGDSGFGPHYQEIGQRFGGFDLVMLDSGQYDPQWANIHMNPEQAAQAAEDLKAAAYLPAHAGRFTIAYHAWDDPFVRAAAASDGRPFRFVTPMIGEPVRLGDDSQAFTRWWEADSLK
ncbi:MBL fold metallo-hydrolase [Deltaproteobacteria bacterium Smac51]|nr:MBL fold metallo-hydrolase [Deltaproteobacteria bacterium Smac51]